MHPIVSEAREVRRHRALPGIGLVAKQQGRPGAANHKVCYNNDRSGLTRDRRPKDFMINLTPVASTKVKEIMTMQNPSPVALRVAVVGGGCSGFQYHMAFENQTNDTDQIFEFDGLKVAVDQMSSMYLDGIEIDYIETVEGAGFKFNNPNVKSTCGCGSSFSV
jgi:iron-sulfur cluster assembly accessory protein